MANLVRIASAFAALVPAVLCALPAACVIDDPGHAYWTVRSPPVFQPPPKPTQDVVYLRGEFSIPGPYAFVPPTHLVEAIDAAGGLTSVADPRVVVSRRLDDGRLVRWVVSTDAVRTGAADDPELVAEDTIDALGVHW